MMTTAEEKVILVTGGTGLIGSAIKTIVNKEAKKPNEKWVFTSSKDVDLTDPDATKTYFETVRPTQVIHLAAKPGGFYAISKANLNFFKTNMKINDNVLNCSHELGVEKVVCCISTCSYPKLKKFPIDETTLHNGPPHELNFGTAYSQRMLDVLIKGYASQYGRRYTSVIAANVYGPNDNFSIEDGHVLPSLMHKIYLAKKTNSPLTVWGTGSAQRQFIYSLDLARLMIWALREYNEIEPIIVSVDEEDEVLIRDLVGIITSCMNFEDPVIYDTSKSDGVIKKTASNQKLRRYRPDFKFTALQEGVKETCKWFTENYDAVRK